MSYTVRLRKSAATVYTFTSPTPFVAPVHAYEHDDSEPPRLAVLAKTWVLQGVLYAASEALAVAAWDGLKALLDVPASIPDGVQLLRGATLVDSIATEDGYEAVKVETLESPRTDLQWRGEMAFSLRVTGRKRFTTTTTSAGVISKISTQETWAYDEAGLLTRTLTGELEAASGSAVAIARTLGLALPGGDYAYETNGPDGVDVERLDLADRRARFTSRVRQAGATLPGGVGPSFSKRTSVSRGGGSVVTTVSATARGTGAEAAVRAARPSGQLAAEEVDVDPFGRSASATYVSREPDTGAPILKFHRLSTRGGGRPRAWSRMSGGRPPILHVLSFGPVELEEECLIELVGNAPGTDSYKFPGPVPGLVEDTSKMSFDGPTRIAVGASRSQDVWQMRLVRGYVGASLPEVLAAASKQALAPGSGSTPTAEAARQAKG